MEKEIKEELADYNLSVLAKEYGFGMKNSYVGCYTYFDINKKEYNEKDCVYKSIGKSSTYSWTSDVNPESIKLGIQLMDNSLDEFILRPTLTLLSTWFREVHDISVCVDFREVKDKKIEGINSVYYDVNIYSISGGYAWKKIKLKEISDDFNIALAAGLKEAFTLLKDK